ncbi:DUF2157 domain-containing protein [Aliidiomarina minuta]|uniref:DUF2157 domain-containing protein n=1 Tax=Aliidiomarina minuta TaxID=880057 RepID=A0A432W4G2_9GAMM|nr:DUF2157 domain-containing protein [Aliidiomarina minuta]RUO24349.1 DUF2157 domain-containing protein [Aliidiomarina minuta]
MKITRETLESAVKKDIISSDQADELLRFFKAQPSTGPSFDFTHVLYYMGGLIAIGAMTLFMNLGWENFGGWGILFISLIYAAIGLRLTSVFQRKGYAIPAGICTTFVVALTPLAIYGLQQAMGWWPVDATYQDYHRYIRWHWIYMELGTLAVGAIMAFKYRYPFLVMPIAVTLWYLSMDIAAVIAGGSAAFELRTLVSLYFGLAMLLFAFWVDMRGSKSGDYAFWLYLFGVLTFWWGLTLQNPTGELSRFLYFCINLVLIGVGVVIVRRVFVIFGAIGGSLYLGHLASEVFKDSFLFPVALTLMGLGIIYLGVLWQKNEAAITARVRQRLPSRIQAFLAQRTE